MKKRLLLLLCLLVTAGSAAWAEIAHGNCKRGSWVIDDSGKLTVNINGDMADYSEGDAPWYGYADQITAIHIGSGCTNIGRNGFYGLSEVRSVTGGENVEACAMYSFEECGVAIPEIYLPKCNYVGECAFRGCAAVRIVLPVVEEVRAKAFANCNSLYQIDLGSKIESIGVLAFSRCPLMWVDNTPNIFMSNPTPPKLYTKVEASVGDKIKTFFKDAGIWLGMTVLSLTPLVGGFSVYAIGQWGVTDAIFEDLKNGNIVVDEYGNVEYKENGYSVHESDYWDDPFCYNNFMEKFPEDKWFNPFSPKPTGESWQGGEPIICVPANLVQTYRDYYYEAENMKYGNWGYIDDDAEGMGTSERSLAAHGAIMAGGKLGTSFDQGWWMKANQEKNISQYDYKVVIDPSKTEEALVFGGDMKTIGMSAINAHKSWAKSLFIGSNSKFPEGAFQGWNNLEYVNLGLNSEITKAMFKGCTNLIRVDSYAEGSIAEEAFMDCPNLGHFDDTGKKIKTVGARAFKNCTKLGSMDLPRVNAILNEAFMNCPELVYFYSNGNSGRDSNSSAADIEVVGESAFEGCNKLYAISLRELRELGKRAFYGCERISEFSPGSYFTIIPEEAFASSGIVRIRVNGTQGYTFGSKSFANSQLTKNFDTNERGIFTDNTEFSRITSVASDAFQGLELKDIPLHCSYKAHDIYNKDAVLSQMDFRPYAPEYYRWSVQSNGWELTPSGIMTITSTPYFINGDKPEFYPWYPYRDLIKKVIINDGQSTISKYMFAGLTQLTDVHVPRSVKRIMDNAFQGCTSLKNIYISRVETLGNNVFEGCESLREIEMDEELKSAGDYIFKDCKNLNDIYNKSEDPAKVTKLTFASIGSEVYPTSQYARGKANEASGVNLHVPRSAVLNYMIDDNWNKLHIAYADDRGTWEKAGKFGDGAWILYDDGTMVVSANQGLPAGSTYEVVQKELKFAAYPNDPKDNEPKLMTKRLEIDGNITELGTCFQGFKNLEEVVMKAPVRKLDGTFRACEKLANISTATLEEISGYTFQGCKALTNLSLPAAKFIGIDAFRDCSQLQTVQLGPSCELKAGVFQGCTSLTHIDLSTATTNGGWLFKGCTSLKGVIFHGTSVGQNMFEGCTALEEIDLGENVQTIGKYAFGGCTSLKTIYISRPTPAQLWKVNDNVTIDGATQSKYVSPFTNTTDYTDLDYKNIEVKIPNTFIVAYTSNLNYLWREMKIVMDEDYEEELLPTGGSLYGNGKGTSGQHVASGSSWNLDADGTLTLDAAGEIARYRSDKWPYNGVPDVWAFTFTPWLYFIHNIVVTDDVTDLPSYMFDAPWGGIIGDNTNASAGVKSVTLGEKVKSVGDYTFNFSGLTDVYMYSEDWVNLDPNCFDPDALAANNATLHLVTTLPDHYFESYKGWLPTRNFPNIVRDIEPKDPKVQAVSFPMAELTMYVGQSIQLEPQFTPSNVKNKTLRYNNLLHNYNVRIDEDGVMTAQNEGVAYIEAFSSYTINGEEVQATWGPLDEIYLKVTIVEELKPEPVFFDVFTYEASDAPWVTYHVLRDEYINVETQIKTCEVAGQYNEDDVTTQAIPEWMVGSVNIPEIAEQYEVVRIGAYSFYERQISAVWIPWTVTQIGYNAFASCYLLKDVFIPNFEPLRLTNVWGEEDENLWNNDAFYRVGEDVGGATLHVPVGCREAWNVYPWNEWFRFIVEDASIPVGIKDVKDSKDLKGFENNWFDLTGRKLGRKPMKPGLYINGGKKVVIK